jgi:hypothetical protein
VIASDDQQARSLTVLLVDEGECGPGPDCLLTDASLSSAAGVRRTSAQTPPFIGGTSSLTGGIVPRES